MSSCPGLTLEAYLGWAHSLVIEGEPENNTSIGIAETLGMTLGNRPVLTKEQFAPIVAMFEEYREQVERYLLDFDEDNQSWRDYAGAVFGFIPDELDTKVSSYIKTLTEEEVPNSAVMSIREMILFLFKRGTDFANPASTTASTLNTAPLSLGWCWKMNEGTGEFVAVRGDGKTVTKKDVDDFVEGLNTSFVALHPANEFQSTEEVKEQGIPVEYITKEMLASIRHFVVLPKIIKGLCDSIALITAHAHYDGPQQENFVKARASSVLRDITAAIVPSNLDYFTGNGPMARYLREHLALEQLMIGNGVQVMLEADSLQRMRKEINEKFNLNPSGHMDSIEWKNIIISMIDLQHRFFNKDLSNAYENLWKQVDQNQPIMESGLYIYGDNQRAINLVMNVDGVPITVTVVDNQDPMINVYHEWEEANINVYGICFFPGMYKAMTEEIEKLTVEK